MTVQDLFWRVKKNPLVRGVTFSGGEPFSQAEPFTELAKLLKANGYEVASYTGYTFEELLENGTPAQKQLLAALDILVDLSLIHICHCASTPFLPARLRGGISSPGDRGSP